MSVLLNQKVPLPHRQHVLAAIVIAEFQDVRMLHVQSCLRRRVDRRVHRDAPEVTVSLRQVINLTGQLAI